MFRHFLTPELPKSLSRPRRPREEQTMVAYGSCANHPFHRPSTVGSVFLTRGQQPLTASHLGSVMPVVCLTRPQYVLRSYCDSGSSRLPGREADMLGDVLRVGLASPGTG